MKKLRIPIIILLSCVLLAGVIWIVIDLKTERDDASYAEEIRMLYRPGENAALPLSSEESVHSDAAFSGQTSEIQESEPASMQEDAGGQMLRIHPDFKALYRINTDLVGWLTAGKDIDYPVVQLDNAFYLNHNFNRESDRNGTLFVNEANTLSPRDDVILIHGHRMKSGAQFGRLKEFKSYAYLSEYPIVAFRTIDEDTAELYVPFAAFDASADRTKPDYFDFLQLQFEDDETQEEGAERSSAAFRAYLDELRARSVWTSPVDVNETDAILLLVTCSSGRENARFALCCRKLRDGETEETVRIWFP